MRSDTTTKRTCDGNDRAAIRRQRSKLETMLSSSHESKAVDPKIPSTMGDEDLVNAVGEQSGV